MKRVKCTCPSCLLGDLAATIAPEVHSTKDLTDWRIPTGNCPTPGCILNEGHLYACMA